jgi:hypothetical protein
MGTLSLKCVETRTPTPRPSAMNLVRPTVVAIPVRDEADRIGACLAALDAQTAARFDHIVLLLNNCTDNTAAVARVTPLCPATRLHVLEHTFPPHQANAGHARRIAMQEAAKRAGPHGVILTTDADGLVDPDWLSTTLHILEGGVDVVAGWVDLHPVEWGQIPIALHEDDARECAYDALCDEIHALLDPDPSDPLPRHTQHSGASIAVTAAAYARAGGVPDIPSGEDRAFIAALRRADCRIRHAPEVHVSVSGRIQGRSVGGMADTIRRRMIQPDRYLDDRLEPAADCARRARCRAALRLAHGSPFFDRAPLSRLLRLPRVKLDAILDIPEFGRAWDALEAAAPALHRRRVAVADLPRQMAGADSILAELRPGPVGRSDSLGHQDERRDLAPLRL